MIIPSLHLVLFYNNLITISQKQTHEVFFWCRICAADKHIYLLISCSRLIRYHSCLRSDQLCCLHTFFLFSSCCLWSTITRWLLFRSELRHQHNRGFRKTLPQVVKWILPKTFSRRRFEGRRCQSVPGVGGTFPEAKITCERRNEGEKNTQKNQGTILQNYYFLSLKLVWGKLLWKVIYCMLSWEPFSTGAFIINHTFPRTNHHALKKPFWGSQRLIYLLLCCGSKQSTKSTILQLYTCLAADSNMYSMYRSHVKAGFRHVGAPHRWFSVLCLSTGGPNEVSISKCESFCAETVWEHYCANILLFPIHETKKP